MFNEGPIVSDRGKSRETAIENNWKLVDGYDDICKQDLKFTYEILSQCIITSDQARWNRLGYFLVFNSVLILAWSRLWTHAETQTQFLGVITLMGFVGSLSWALIGRRANRYHFQFLAVTHVVEKRLYTDFISLSEEMRPHKSAEMHAKDDFISKPATSRYATVGMPWSFTVVYVFLGFELTRSIVTKDALNIPLLDPINIPLVEAIVLFALWIVGWTILSIDIAKAPEKEVYVSKSRTKYHREECPYLTENKIAVSLNQAQGRGLTACKVCRPE